MAMAPTHTATAATPTISARGRLMPSPMSTLSLPHTTPMPHSPLTSTVLQSPPASNTSAPQLPPTESTSCTSARLRLKPRLSQKHTTDTTTDAAPTATATHTTATDTPAMPTVDTTATLTA